MFPQQCFLDRLLGLYFQNRRRPSPYPSEKTLRDTIKQKDKVVIYFRHFSRFLSQIAISLPSDYWKRRYRGCVCRGDWGEAVCKGYSGGNVFTKSHAIPYALWFGIFYVFIYMQGSPLLRMFLLNKN